MMMDLTKSTIHKEFEKMLEDTGVKVVDVTQPSPTAQGDSLPDVVDILTEIINEATELKPNMIIEIDNRISSRRAAVAILKSPHYKALLAERDKAYEKYQEGVLNYAGAMYEISEICRVWVNNPQDFNAWMLKNFPKEMTKAAINGGGNE